MCMQEDNVKVDLKAIRSGGVYLIQRSQNTAQWRTLVKPAMKLLVI
jgi:hypothetical protein